MIFRQLFDQESYTYTYLLGDPGSGEAILIDPVLDKVDRYIQLLDELNLKLVKAVDTHLHADHITALGALRDRTRCVTVMGEQSKADVISVRVKDGDKICAGNICLDVIHTPGHTDDSYCYKLDGRLFTGDTLLIRGTGRTDFQNGNAETQYDSLFNNILKLPDETLVYPGHDYKGDTVSTIGEEKKHNPRLQVCSIEEYVELMNGLNLDNPRMMDVAVPNNMKIGLSQEKVAQQGWAIDAEQALTYLDMAEAILIDLRDEWEQQKYGLIPGSEHLPYSQLDDALAANGKLWKLNQQGKKAIFYCAYGERSAMAVEAAQLAGLKDSVHLTGGIDSWKNAGGEVQY